MKSFTWTKADGLLAIGDFPGSGSSRARAINNRGWVVGEIVDGEMKAELLRKLAEQENIALEQTIAVGDGANDLPMISIAGLGVAFNAKPVVREKAANAISSVGLDGLLYLIGIHDREIKEKTK